MEPFKLTTLRRDRCALLIGSLRIVTMCLLATLVVCGVAWSIIFRERLGCHLLPSSGVVKVC